MKKLCSILTILVALNAQAQPSDLYPTFRHLGSGGLGFYSGNTGGRPTGDVRWVRWNTDSSRLEVKTGPSTWKGIPFTSELVTGGGGGGGNPFADNTDIIKNSSDNTKLLRFSAASISTGTTRTWTFPDVNGTVARNDAAQTFSGIQTFGTHIISPILYGGTGTTSPLTISATSNGSPAAGSDIYFMTGTSTELMRISQNGNVGIGTVGGGAPLTKLQVVGITQSTNFAIAGAAGMLGLNGALTDGIQITKAALFSQSNNLFLQGLLGAASGYFVVESAGNTVGLAMSSLGTNPIGFFPNRTEAARFNSSGELMIASTTDPGDYKAQITGGLYVNSASKDISLNGIPVSGSTATLLVRNDSVVKQLGIGSGLSISGGNLTASGGGNTIYSANDVLASNRTVGGNSKSLTIGSSGDKLSSFALNSVGDIGLGSDDQIFLLAGTVYKETQATDADLTVTSAMHQIYLPVITADRAVTFPSVFSGQVYMIVNNNTAAFNWNISGGGASLYDAQHNTISTLNSQTVYHIRGINDASLGAYWEVVAVEGLPLTTSSSAGTLTLAYNLKKADYLFTGSTTTWTLPAVSSTRNGFEFNLINAGSGSITLNSSGGGNDIYNGSATNSITITAGSTKRLTLINSIFYAQ